MATTTTVTRRKHRRSLLLLSVDVGVAVAVVSGRAKKNNDGNNNDEDDDDNGEDHLSKPQHLIVSLHTVMGRSTALVGAKKSANKRKANMLTAVVYVLFNAHRDVPPMSMPPGFRSHDACIFTLTCRQPLLAHRF